MYRRFQYPSQRNHEARVVKTCCLGCHGIKLQPYLLPAITTCSFDNTGIGCGFFGYQKLDTQHAFFHFLFSSARLSLQKSRKKRKMNSTLVVRTHYNIVMPSSTFVAGPGVSRENKCEFMWVSTTWKKIIFDQILNTLLLAQYYAILSTSQTKTFIIRSHTVERMLIINYLARQQ